MPLKKPDFGYCLKNCRATAKRKGLQFDIDLDDLYWRWLLQKGRCGLSKIPMENPPRRGQRFNPRSASVDRIDNDKGYIPSNIQFVCYSLNLAKNNFADEEIMGFIHEIQLKGTAVADS